MRVLKWKAQGNNCRSSDRITKSSFTNPSEIINLEKTYQYLAKVGKVIENNV